MNQKAWHRERPQRLLKPRLHALNHKFFDSWQDTFIVWFNCDAAKWMPADQAVPHLVISVEMSINKLSNSQASVVIREVQDAVVFSDVSLQLLRVLLSPSSFIYVLRTVQDAKMFQQQQLPTLYRIICSHTGNEPRYGSTWNGILTGLSWWSFLVGVYFRDIEVPFH